MASSNIDISGLDYLNNTDYAMSSGLEDWNDEEKMNKLLAAVVADEVPEIRDTPSETMFNRVINRVSPIPPDDGGSMFNQSSIPSPSPDPEDWDNWGGLGEFSNKSDSPPGEEPDKKGGGPTLWDVAAMGVGGPELWVVKQVLGQLFKNGNPSQKDGMFQDVEFKPWALDKFEDRMNEAPLLDRWAIQMKEQIGWQYMTPAERRDYIKNNKHDKNNHIIMDYNMYRR